MKAQISSHLLIIASVALALGFNACTFSTASSSERPSHASDQKQQANTEHCPLDSELNDDQLKTLLKTEFKGWFEMDARHISPGYLVGDFNGDGVRDIAIPVRLSRKPATTDKSKPPFWFRKPLACSGDPSTAGLYAHPFTMSDLARYYDEPDRPSYAILAVIHGTPTYGWSESQPQNRFVIVDAWNFPPNTMSLYRGVTKPAAIGDAYEEVPPQLMGDAILMLTEDTTGTAVIWDGAGYCWYPTEGLENITAAAAK